MATITLGGNAIHTSGSLPEVGSDAPDFLLTKNDLSDVSLKDFSGKKIILNIFPSLDTGICAASVRRFNSEAGNLDNTVVLGVSVDLPFAHSRFCEAEGIENVITLSDLRNKDFGENYGVRIVDGPLAGVFSRAIVIVGTDGKVVYTQQAPDIKQEPDYEAALNALR
jgi:thiol peroxidase